jgi:hypothetical protein
MPKVNLQSIQKILVLVLIVLAAGSALLVFNFFSTLSETRQSAPERFLPPTEAIKYQKALLFLPVYRDGSTPDHVMRALQDGANIITIGITAKTVGNDLQLTNWEMQKEVSTMLTQEAYRNKMHVEVRILGDPGSDRTTDFKAMTESAALVVREVAKFSQEIGASRMGIFGEVDNGWVMGANHEATDRFIQTVLPIAREHFKGEVGMGFCCDLNSYNVMGYDYIVISINPGGDKSQEEWLRNLPDLIRRVNHWALSYGVSNVIIGEVGFLTKEEAQRFPEAKLFTWILDSNAEAELYKKMIEKTKDLVSGYTFYYGLPILTIKGMAGIL